MSNATTLDRVYIQGIMGEVENLTGTAFTGEAGAHVIRVSARTVDGEAVTLSGTVTGAMLRADGVTVALSGSIVSGAAVVTLNENCYAVPGRGQLSVFVADGAEVTCLWSAVISVARTTSSAVVDPEEIIPNLSELQTAANNANTAAEAANTAATAAAAAMAGAVRFDQAQTLTDAQKATALGNVGAADASVYVSTGAAQTFTEAAQATARGNIGAADAHLTDTVVENVPYNGADGSVTDGRTLTRVGTVYTLDGTASGNRRFKLSGALAVTTSPEAQEAWAFEVDLEGGETYTLRVDAISGTLSVGSTSLTMWVEDADAKLFSITLDGGSHTFVWPDGTKKGRITLYVAKATTTTAYKFRLLLYKDSMARLESDLAPMEDSATASAAHTAGSLLMMGGQLYKATAAIASGDTITPGSSGNVAATSVAAEFTPEITKLTLASGASSDIVDTNFNRWSYCCRIGRIVFVYLFMGMRSLPADGTVITTIPDSCKPADFYQVIQTAYNSDKNILLKINENGNITMHRTSMSTGADTFIACFHYILT